MKNYKYNRSRGFHGQKNKSSGKYRHKRSGNRNRYRNKGASINPNMFVKKAADVIQVPYMPACNFADLPLNAAVKRNILARGFDKPTPIQDQAILPILDGKDLVGVANTGTGKTAAFLLPLITKVARDRQQKVLVVTPTRELATQIQDDFKLFSMGLGLSSVLCIGGVSLRTQARKLSSSPSFVVGTPGRIRDLENRKVLQLNQYTSVVLDEVDCMLDMGFIHDITQIILSLPKIRQSLFFSATIPNGTKKIMQGFLTNPTTVSVGRGATPQNVDQDIVRVRGKDKLETLHQLLIKQEFTKVLIFGRTKWGVNKLEKNLSRRGFRTAAIHGNKSQYQRSRALDMLKSNKVQILIATDVASRGLDIENVTHVINYDVPGSYNDYIHRVGRTGRAGKKGVALTFID